MTAEKTKIEPYGPVDASPVKSFFVSMLTRDIGLEEAILDLLDNCVDGILRLKRKGGAARPYENFRAEIEFDERQFSIADNCGGIPWNLHDYAFRMGRASGAPADVPGTVGVYGIGMKRAIFKMGKDCLIRTQSGGDAYEVHVSPDWIRDEMQWDIPVNRAAKKFKEDGTVIVVKDLNEGVAARFSKEAQAFTTDLERMIATHYAFIIEKGLSVKVNGQLVKPRPTRLVFAKDPKGRHSIRPFIFRTTSDGVEVFLAVGFTRPIPSQDEAVAVEEETRHSALDAGWTVLCNDRAVLYCDRTELTGWGEAGVPRYHNQFIAISGIVEFRSKDASKLPTTTTKRGIDTSSPLYLRIKNKMREGMSIFTDYTNKWKGRADESKQHMDAAGDPLMFHQVKAESKRLHFQPTRLTVPRGEQYKPALPLPKALEPRKRRISYVKDVEDIQAVAEYLFGDPESEPSKVGEECFDRFHREATR